MTLLLALKILGRPLMGGTPARAVGAVSQDGLPAEERKGVLWDAMRTLAAQGWEPDTFSYSTAFRHAAAAASCAPERCIPPAMMRCTCATCCMCSTLSDHAIAGM